ncbi:nucleotide sugar dehydrogenase [Deinococcus sp. RM]|uniref:nucleotide sugar dehydrogenase n=1 Tax=Deinococcus sp. RM TaxID=2316359 RepID=UPI000E683398|nr:UDP-glucose/GDP-mannose dehydrogenase family protein [Deinococcus sp. RM]RIY01657.1 UDP-glucose/GDP-mannose dehydrogenase family protein [Deinococcus sp. RM]
MKISVFGLGYVGAVTAACFSRDGHSVVGVDVSMEKVEMVRRGESPIVEPSLAEYLAEGVQAERITATTSALDAVNDSDISLISVGTPPSSHGGPDLSYVYKVCEEIGQAIARKGVPHVVVLRSTVPPGTLARCQEILDEAAGRRVHTAFNPEFLREGSAIADYYAPAYTIIGTQDATAEAAVRMMYQQVAAPIIVVEPAVAEMVKYVANTWHAAKITFANEIGRMAKAFSVDGRDVMRLVAMDDKLNCSPAYMRPGFAYGGSCLPKDLGSLLHYAREKNVSVPFLKAIPVSNALTIDLAAQAALTSGARRVTVLGLAFKSNTDDMRESPAVPLVKRLLGEGYEVRIYDPFVEHARLLGTNLSYIQQNIPHFERLLDSDGNQSVKNAELIILTYGTEEFRTLIAAAPQGTKVLDLAGVFKLAPEHVEYHALAW